MKFLLKLLTYKSLHYYYLYINIGTLLFPFLLSFDKKVAFFSKYKSWLPAILISSFLYLAWDIWFTKAGVWKFNIEYIQGGKFFDLPWEEYLFFVTVPYACLFIYECLVCYFPKYKTGFENSMIWVRVCTVVMLAVAFVALYFSSGKLYSLVTFLLFAISFTMFALVLKKTWWQLAFLSMLIALVPMALVNGLLTSLPILIYNNAENLNIRIHTLPLNHFTYGIPFEDFFYNMIYMSWMIALFEWRRNGLQSR